MVPVPVARIGERARWLRGLTASDFDNSVDSFAVRPPSNSTRHVAALHFPGRLDGSEAGITPKLTPLSCRGPHGTGSIVALCRLLSSDTFMISKARQGNSTMHIYPFAKLWKSGKKEPGKTRKASGAAKAAAFDGKTCHLCCDSDDGPGYDLWHVLFECPATVDQPAIVRVRRSCQNCVAALCSHIVAATESNAASMSNTKHAGVDHDAIRDSAQAVKQAARGYDWHCMPGRWLTYCLLLALPFSERVVSPPPQSASPALPDSESQYSLPRAVGRLFDATVLTHDALRPLADDWCRRSVQALRAIGEVVCPLRTAAEERREPARAAARAARRAAPNP